MKTVTLFVADTHCGSVTGIMTRHQWQGKSFCDPNHVQKIVRGQFDEGISAAYDARKRGYRLIVCVVGDAIDGNHHKTVELVTPDIEEQKSIHVAVMEEALEKLKFNRKKGDLLYYIEGTEAHTGSSEGAIAKDLHAVPYRNGTKENKGEDGQYVWPRLILTINGVRIADDWSELWNPYLAKIIP